MSRFEGNADDVRRKIRAGVRRNMREALLLYQRGLQQTLTGQRSGERYRVPFTGEFGVPGTGRYYTASAPGEAPARRTGDLHGSIDQRLESDTHGVAGTDKQYGLYLDRGTRNMRPRPWIRPGFYRVEREIIAAMTRRVD